MLTTYETTARPIFPRSRALLAALLFFLSAPSFAAIQLTTVVSDLTSPTFVGHAGDGSNRLFIIQRGGIIRVLQPGASASTNFMSISTKVVAGGERGLLGLAFHPQYSANGRFFVYYTRAGDGTLVIAEYAVTADRDVADPLSEKLLLTIPHPNTNHNGGMLAFGNDGYLYVGVGDGGSANDPPNNAQNINQLLGKILRIDVDHPDIAAGTLYSSPPDNPYVGVPGRDEIFSIGWRNPWRFSFDRATHQQWVADVGQGAREEVDTPIAKGGNYGWRVYEGSGCTGIDPGMCVPANYLLPIFDYTHSGGRCSITGGYVYRGSQNALPQGTYVYGDYCSGEIFSWNGTAQTVELDTALNITSFGEDEQGEIYVVGLGGSVSRIGSAQTGTTTTLGSATNPSVFGQGVALTATVIGNAPTGTVAFRDNGVAIPGCGSVGLTGGGNSPIAQCVASNLAVGTHPIVAAYSGDANNSGSSSQSLSQIVNAAGWTLTNTATVTPPAGNVNSGTSCKSSGNIIRNFSPATGICSSSDTNSVTPAAP